MSYRLIHRGPDSRGSYADNNIALGVRRLSIIDVSEGNQPLFNEDQSLVLVANGEIYNYIELTAQLKTRGHIFHCASDCEVILHLYEENGINCLQSLRGMFAFALWDKLNHKLILARDRLGEKPLYFYNNQKEFIFASELKSLLTALPQKPSLDFKAVDLFFRYQYIPEPMTALKEIRKLPAAHYLDISLGESEVLPKRYWKALEAAPIEAKASCIIRQEFESLIPLILRSDVPVGISLSSGLDSGLIALLSAAKYKGRLYAFTVGYTNRPDCDERAQAKGLAEAAGISFYDLEISCKDFLRDLPEIIKAADDPIADIAAYGYYRVMRLAHSHKVKVMLCGFGGDELFWGYPWVREAAQKKLFYELEPGYQEAEKILPDLYDKNFIDMLPSLRAAGKLSLGYSGQRPDLEVCQLIIDTWLISNCVALGDRMSMANSVELRLPFLDFRFVETIFGLMKKYPDYQLPDKIWLKEAFKDLFPPKIVNSPKRGFTPPYQIWRREALNKYGYLLRDGFLAQKMIFQPQALKKFMKLAKGSWFRNPVAQELAYKILYFELWCRIYLENESL